MIFADVDGVLTGERTFLTMDNPKGIKNWYAWDPVAVEAIKLACAKDIRIVVSSTWRHERHQPELFAQLAQHNMGHLLVQPEWRTPDFNRRGCDVGMYERIRGNEVADWLSRHPEVISYRILDDTQDFLAEQMKYLIWTNPDDGMTSENIRALLRWSGYLKS